MQVFVLEPPASIFRVAKRRYQPIPDFNIVVKNARRALYSASSER